MRYREFLLEYNRDVTKRQFGEKIVDKLQHSPDKDLFYAYYKSLGEKEYPIDKIIDTIATNILSSFENNDPTPNNQYTPWIAREYVKGNIRRLEDLSRIKSALETYHKYKNTRQFKELFKYNVGFNDIGKLSADQIEGIAEKLDQLEPQQSEKDKGESVEVYNGPDARVIVPEDRKAACYYGQGTRWCTASTKGDNYFDHYHGQGSLYIILPKKPAYEGEKYQLHVYSEQFMDEGDNPESLSVLLQKFPGFTKWLKDVSDEPLDDLLLFVDTNTLTELNKIIAEIIKDWAFEEVNDWEVDDDYYRQWQQEFAIERGYVDKDGEIDWDRVYEDPQMTDYLEYNDDARRLVRYANDLEDVTGQEIMNTMNAEGDWTTVDKLENFYTAYAEKYLGGDIEGKIHRKLVISKTKNTGKNKKIYWAGKAGDYYVGVYQ